MNSTNKTTPALVGIIAILAILGGAGYVVVNGHEAAESASTSVVASKTEDDSAATTASAANSTSTTSATTTPTASTATSSGYKDGTYSATANYSVPRADNSITVKLIVSSGKITAVTTSHNYGDRESGMYIDSFDSEIKSVVVGQNLGSVSPSRVGGASLTTIGFDDALQSIVSQAKA